MAVSRIKMILFYFFIIWVFLSAFYYAPNLLNGHLLVGRFEEFPHKISKYLIAASLSVIYFFLYGDSRLALHGFAVAFIGGVIGLQVFHDCNVIFGLESIIVLAAFIGLGHYSSRISSKQVFLLSNTIILSAFFVSVISFFEFQLFESVLGDYWRNTGGFRSVSTLLNPNNLGIYLGAALLLLSFNDSLKWWLRIIVGFIISCAFYLSGSRTAWVSCVFSLSFVLVYRGNSRLSKRYLLYFSTILMISAVLFPILIGGDFFTIPDRVIDMYTAYLRLEKYFMYVSGIDESYILPDFNESRIEMVSESGYFHFVNALGLLWAGLLIISFSLSFRVGWLRNLFKKSPCRQFDALLLYYGLAMLFENVLMSFPNNQLIFIALGVTVSGWKNKVIQCRPEQVSSVSNY